MNQTWFFIIIFTALFVGVALDQATGNLFLELLRNSCGYCS